MVWRRAILAACVGGCIGGALGSLPAAHADPDSAFFSQSMYNQQAQQQQGPWAGSMVNIPSLTSTGTVGAGNVDLGAISAGQGGAMGGWGVGMQGLSSALSAPTNVMPTGGGAGVLGLGVGGGTGGVSPGAIGSGITGSALGGVFGLNH